MFYEMYVEERAFFHAHTFFTFHPHPSLSLLRLDFIKMKKDKIPSITVVIVLWDAGIIDLKLLKFSGSSTYTSLNPFLRNTELTV